MVNLPNWLPLTFAVPGSACFSPWTGDLLSYRQELDMRHGVLHRQLRFVDVEDRMTSVRQRRLVSMADPYLAALETPSWPRTGPARFTYAPLSGRVTNRGAPVRQLRGDHLTGHATGTDLWPGYACGPVHPVWGRTCSHVEAVSSGESRTARGL